MKNLGGKKNKGGNYCFSCLLYASVLTTIVHTLQLLPTNIITPEQAQSTCKTLLSKKIQRRYVELFFDWITGSSEYLYKTARVLCSADWREGQDHISKWSFPNTRKKNPLQPEKETFYYILKVNCPKNTLIRHVRHFLRLSRCFFPQAEKRKLWVQWTLTQKDRTKCLFRLYKIITW